MRGIYCPECGDYLDYKHLFFTGLTCGCDVKLSSLVKATSCMPFVTYFLVLDDSIVYVGSTIDLQQRMQQHVYNGQLSENSVLVKRIGSTLYDVLNDKRMSLHISTILGELEMFNIFKPVYNKAMPCAQFSDIVYVKDPDGNFSPMNTGGMKYQQDLYGADELPTARSYGDLEMHSIKLSLKQRHQYCFRDESPSTCRCPISCVHRANLMKLRVSLPLPESCITDDDSICVELLKTYKFGTGKTALSVKQSFAWHSIFRLEKIREEMGKSFYTILHDAQRETRSGFATTMMTPADLEKIIHVIACTPRIWGGDIDNILLRWMYVYQKACGHPPMIWVRIELLPGCMTPPLPMTFSRMFVKG